MTPTLMIFAKVPMPGRVKTRLAADIGPVAAAGWSRRTLAGLVRRVGFDPRWRTVLAVAPDIAGMVSPLLPPGIPRWPQGTGDIGARMARALQRMPPGPVMIVGSDIPAINTREIARGFEVLRGHDAVLGPAEDGGFWLIGLRRGGRPLPADLFRGVRWSGPDALSDTLRGLHGLRVGFAQRLADVDRATDLPIGKIR